MTPICGGCREVIDGRLYPGKDGRWYHYTCRGGASTRVQKDVETFPVGTPVHARRWSEGRLYEGREFPGVVVSQKGHLVQVLLDGEKQPRRFTTERVRRRKT